MRSLPPPSSTAPQLGHSAQAQKAPIKILTPAPGLRTRGLVTAGAAALFFEGGLQGYPAGNRGGGGEDSVLLTLCLSWWEQEVTASHLVPVLALVASLPSICSLGVLPPRPEAVAWHGPGRRVPRRSLPTGLPTARREACSRPASAA